jgi:hypothetical protein
VCRTIPFILNIPKLSYVEFNWAPSNCIACDAWLQAGLAVPPDELVRGYWLPVLRYLRAGSTVAVHELRLMLIGDGEAAGERGEHGKGRTI